MCEPKKETATFLLTLQLIVMAITGGILATLALLSQRTKFSKFFETQALETPIATLLTCAFLSYVVVVGGLICQCSCGARGKCQRVFSMIVLLPVMVLSLVSGFQAVRFSASATANMDAVCNKNIHVGDNRFIQQLRLIHEQYDNALLHLASRLMCSEYCPCIVNYTQGAQPGRNILLEMPETVLNSYGRTKYTGIDARGYIPFVMSDYAPFSEFSGFYSFSECYKKKLNHDGFFGQFLDQDAVKFHEYYAEPYQSNTDQCIGLCNVPLFKWNDPPLSVPHEGELCKHELVRSIEETYTNVGIVGIVHGLVSFSTYITLFCTYARAIKQEGK